VACSVRFGGERWRVERWGWPMRGFALSEESLEYDAEEMRSAWGELKETTLHGLRNKLMARSASFNAEVLVNHEEAMFSCRNCGKRVSVYHGQLK
jgi:hypothetical protein